MAQTATQRLKDIQAKEKRASQGDHGSYTLPPDYQDIIKAAQAEAKGNSSGSKTVTPTARPSNGEGRGTTTRNVPRPSSRDEAFAANEGERTAPSRVPTPTARPSAPNEASTETQSGDASSGLLSLLGAAGLSAAAAYSLYKLAARGDKQAIEDIKTTLGEVATQDAQKSASPDQDMIENRILDADFEEIPDQKQLTNIDETINDVDGVAREARPMLAPDEMPQAVEAAPQQKMLAAPEESNIDAEIARQIEGDVPYERSQVARPTVEDPQAVVEGRTGRLRGRPEVPRPRVRAPRG